MSDFTPASERDIVDEYDNLYGVRRLPNAWVFNDFGHLTIYLYRDINGNRVYDRRVETIHGEFIHSTPKLEAANAQNLRVQVTGMDPSHGCVHVQPHHIDELVNLGYVRRNSYVFVHPYGQLVVRFPVVQRKAKLDAVFASTACRAASCYAGWLEREHYASGTQRAHGVLQPLAERELGELLRQDAPGQQLWRESQSCIVYKQAASTVELCGRESPALGETFVAHLFHDGRCHGVLTVTWDIEGPVAKSCPERLLQIAPVLSALIALRNAWKQFDVDAASNPAALGCIASVQCELSFEPDVSLDDDVDHEGGPITSVQALSKREQQTAELLVAGYAVVNTAAVLEISEHTVRTYIRRLYRKLGVTNRADLVRRYVGLTNGLVA